DFRAALEYLLLPVLRLGPRSVRRPGSLSIRSQQFSDDAKSVRGPRALGRSPEAMGVHPGMGARRARLGHRRLSHLRSFHVLHAERATLVFQEGSEAVVGNELRGTAALHPRPAA